MWRSPIAELADHRRQRLLQTIPHATATTLDTACGELVASLRAHAPALADEFDGIAQGANVDATALMVVQAHDELVDQLAPATATVPARDSGTTMYLWGEHGAVLGQTLDLPPDLHPYLRVVRVRPRHGDDEAVVLTLTGCLGLAGVNHARLAVVSAALSTRRAGAGVISAAIVRDMLTTSNAHAARTRLWPHPLAGGHHYLLADGTDLFGIEVDAQEKVTTRTSPHTAHLHTNHYFDPKLRAHERVPAHTTSFRRMELASTLFVQRQPKTAHDLVAFLTSHEGHPHGLCSHGREPNDAQTSAVFVMDLARGRVVVVPGCPRKHEPFEIPLTRWPHTATTSTP